jgi:hypothetical protein
MAMKALSTFQQESLKDQAQNIHEEARMVLPGVQALFGFQLIAVFNQRFSDLSPVDRQIHLAALLLVAIAIGMIMTPAAYHRLCEPYGVSRYFTRISSRLIAGAMVPLAIAVALDVYIVARMVDFAPAAAAVLGAVVLLMLASLWLVFPVWRRTKSIRSES